MKKPGFLKKVFPTVPAEEKAAKAAAKTQAKLNKRLMKVHGEHAASDIARLLDQGADAKSMEADVAFTLLVDLPQHWKKHPAVVEAAVVALAEAGNEWAAVYSIGIETGSGLPVIGDAGKVYRYSSLEKLFIEMRDPNWKTGRLVDAIRRHDDFRVARILKGGVDPNSKNEFGRSMLEIAVAYADALADLKSRVSPDTAKLLEKKHAEPSKTSLQLLIEAGADVLDLGVINAVADARCKENNEIKFVAEEIKKREAALPSSPPKPTRSTGPLL